MRRLTIEQALQSAVAHHQAGRLAEAERLYRQVLAERPDHAGALHLLGVLAGQVGYADQAIALIERAIAINPNVAEYHASLGDPCRRAGQPQRGCAALRRAIELAPDHAEAHNNLAILLHEQGRQEQAVAACARAIQLEPGRAEFHNNLGSLFRTAGRFDEAITAYSRALALYPEYAAACHNLGVALKDAGRLDEAIAAYSRAIGLRPDHAEGWNNLGVALAAAGRLDEAIDAYARAIGLRPDLAEAHSNLGNALGSRGRLDEAFVASSRAVALAPGLAGAHNNLGQVLCARGQLDEAVAAYRRAIALAPDHAAAHNNLGFVLKLQGRLDEALGCFRKAVELQGDFAAAASNAVYLLHFHPDYDAAAILAEHRRWDARFAAPLARSHAPHTNEPAPDRRLRIGYVSPHLRNHVVGHFLATLLEQHDQRRFEAVCYADVTRPDEHTRRIQSAADVWRDVVGWTDDRMARQIREDRIDVLVDLAQHMAGNRLLVFARKPAPVQVTYLGYCGTTGLAAMDYRLTDPYLDSPGGGECVSSEQSVSLPETYWCYGPAAATPPVGALPASQSGRITFASLNNFCKVTAPTLDAWSRLLGTLPSAQMLLHAHAGSHRDRAREFLAGRGVAPERLRFADMVPTDEYFRLYEHVDVALDPFPYGGGTTTCDALWMGVPVVSLAGRTAVGRGGLSILSNVGLPELVARDIDDYVKIAVNLASDLARLSGLRAGLRRRIERSPLMDAPRFARGVEAAYRTLWQRWCARSGEARGCIPLHSGQ
jgi:predicted O-linked N-acetylglucosamine transferase (SPINDLY family)